MTQRRVGMDKQDAFGDPALMRTQVRHRQAGCPTPRPLLPWVLQCFGVFLLLSCLCGCQTGSTRLRVLAYNIHHGEGADGRLDLQRIAGVITNAHADLAALQEVDNRTERTGRIDQAAELGRLTGMHAVFGKAIEYQGGEYGAAILSRWPIAASAAHVLPGSPGHEQRPALLAKVRPESGGTQVGLVSVHLDHMSETERLTQARRLLELLGQEEAIPLLVAGDLNAVPDSAVLALFGIGWTNATAGQERFTIPSRRPTRQIDYVLCYPAARWRVIETEVLQSAASDHCALLVTLELD